MTARQRAGAAAEDHALEYLRRRGLELVERNFRCAFGEIDLIMRDHDELVFVEVRYRRSQAYGGAAASVTASKRARLARAALYFLGGRRGRGDEPMRFDVMALRGDLQQPRIDWLKAAFQPGDRYA